MSQPQDTQPTFAFLVAVKQHNIALLFANYLQTLNISAQVMPQGDSYVILCPQSLLETARHEFDEFIKQPYHEKYQQAAWEQAKPSDVTVNSPGLLKVFHKQFIGHAGGLTLLIFAVCWLVFILSLMGWGNFLFQQLSFYSAFSVDAIMAQPLKIIGPALFHLSWLHIVFNTMWWWQLGGSIEKSLGSRTLLSVFLISAVVSNIGQYVVSGANFAGLSGVVFALFGYVWWLGWLKPRLGLSVPKPLIGFLLIWMLLGFAEFLPINMANTAHLMGLVCGCILAVIKVRFSEKSEH